VVNPNSSRYMTDSLRPIATSLGLDSSRITCDFFTAPNGPRSINNEDDAQDSVKACLDSLDELMPTYDGFLVACFSAHPLVDMLRKRHPSKHTIGILEASLSMALSICHSSAKEAPIRRWGIVTTGRVWEQLLNEAIKNYLNIDAWKGVFRVETTGMNAGELHELPREKVRERLAQATKRLVEWGEGCGGLKVVILGCAGMSELEDIVRQTVGPDVKVIDGVKAGVCSLQSMVQCGL